jgi:hypothetical protein
VTAPEDGDTSLASRRDGARLYLDGKLVNED